MARLRRLWTSAISAIIVFLLIVVAGVPNQTFAQQSEQRLSREDARALANQLNSIGQPSAAREIALGLLQADATDISALIALSRAELQLGNTDAAKSAVNAAWHNSTSNRERFVAALVTADILANQEAYTRSQFWLRRAIQNAPSAQTRQVAVRAFRRVRQENPLALELSFSALPSSNVNSGNFNETIEFAFLEGTVLEGAQFIVPADERPLSGLEITLQTDLRYRVAQTANSRTSMEFGFFGRTYAMSESAREAAPDVTGASLSNVQASFGVLHQWVPAGTETPFSADLTYSYTWAGGFPSQRNLRGSLGARFRLNETDALSVSGSVRYSNLISSDIDVMTYSALGHWSHAFNNKNVFGLTAQLSRASSEITDLAYRDTTVGVSYDFGSLSIGDQALGIDLATSYTRRFRVYDTSVYDPAGREDQISSLRFDIGVQNVEIYGFQPIMSLQANRTDSSVPRFDTEGVQIGVNLRSSF